jgi:glyoxylase-like metal-dependent hydrolase (beta-lactamase superfamily II)
MHERRLKARSWVGSAALALALTGLGLLAEPVRADQAEPLQLLPVQGNVYLLAGGPVNVTVQVGADGILLVDAPPAERSAEAMKLLRQLSPQPIRLLISTAADAERVAGDQALEPFAEPVPGDRVANLVGPGTRLRALVQENALNRIDSMPASGRGPFDNAVLSDEYGTAERDFYFNNDAIILYHAAVAHSDGDTIVQFRHADVVATGDLFSPGQFPRIDVARGGSVQGELAALNELLYLAIPRRYEEGGTYVVPGRGRICDEADVVEYRDMLRIVTDRVENLLAQHRTLAQVLSARPAFDYETEYGGAHGGPTADEFVSAVYQSLAKPNHALEQALESDIANRFGMSVHVTAAPAKPGAAPAEQP